MSEPTPLLDRAGIEEAFGRLGDRLAKRGVVADIYVLEEARAVAAELGLPNTVAEVLALVQDVFPEEEPPPRLRLLLEDIFGQSI